MKTTEPSADKRGTTLINHWQCGVPVSHGPVATPFFLLLAGLAAIGLDPLDDLGAALLVDVAQRDRGSLLREQPRGGLPQS